MPDPFESSPERSARLARIVSLVGIALGVLVTYLAKTLTYKTGVTVFGGGQPDLIQTFPLARNEADDWIFAISPILLSLAFACAIEIALRRDSRASVRVALGLAAVSVIGTFVLMFSKGVVYSVPWAMALSGSVVLALQALDKRREAAT